jgi:transcriptional regulator with XRE-family HTH domain
MSWPQRLISRQRLPVATTHPDRDYNSRMRHSPGQRGAKKSVGIVAQLREAIRASFISRSELAHGSGISLAVLQQFVRGQRSITFQHAERLCECLGLGLHRATWKAIPHQAIALRKRGLTPREIAATLGVSRRTVFRYYRALPPDPVSQSPKSTPAKGTLRHRLKDGRAGQANQQRDIVARKRGDPISKQARARRRVRGKATIWIRV